jgi:hypothetical protein
MHCDLISRWERADMEATGMVYSSRSGALPEAAPTFGGDVARLACDAHRIRVAAVWRVAADV